MEPYSSSSPSSTSSMYHHATTNNVSQQPPRKSFNSSLHSVRSNNNNSKQSSNHQPWNTKKKLHIAPLPPPNPPRVYKVDPINFRVLVQRLTSQPQQGRILSQRQPPAPAPLQQLLPPKEGEGGGLVVERQEGSPFSSFFRELMTAETTAGQSVDMNMAMMEEDDSNDIFHNNYNVMGSDSATTSTSLELNLLSSPTSSTQHCWFPSQLLSPTAGLDHHPHQRTINL